MNALQTITLSNWRMKLESEELEVFLHQLLNQYEGLGPLPGIVLPFIEAFLPFLPLMFFVLGNTAAFGLLQGFFYSWIGASGGAIAVFFLIRRLRNIKWIDKRVRKIQRVTKVTSWLERHGFGPLFLLLCFPFSPSAVIHVVAGLSKVNAKQFILAVLLGKAVMIFSIAYVGSSMMAFAANPVRAVIILISAALFWRIGKYTENRLQRNKVQQS